MLRKGVLQRTFVQVQVARRWEACIVKHSSIGSTHHGPIEVEKSLHDGRRSERQGVRQLVVDAQLTRRRERLETVERRTDSPHAEIQTAQLAALRLIEFIDSIFPS